MTAKPEPRLGEHLDVSKMPFYMLLARLGKPTLGRAPAQYTAIDRDEAAVQLVSGYLKGPSQQGVVGASPPTTG